MHQPREVVNTLDGLILSECKLYEQYLKLIAEERKHVHPFRPDRMAELSQQRAELHVLMKEAEQKRLEYINNLSGGPVQQFQRLTEFVKDNFSPIDAKRLMLRAEHLKDLASDTHAQSKELGQMVNFSLNMVSSLMSILWSATQNVVKSYSQTGGLKEAYHPAGTRLAGLLKQA